MDDPSSSHHEYEHDRLRRQAARLLKQRHWLLERRDAAASTTQTSAYVLVDHDSDLAALLLRHRGSAPNAGAWRVWVDAPHAPGEVRFNAVFDGIQYTIRQER